MILMFLWNDVILFFDIVEELFKQRISKTLPMEHFIIGRKSFHLVFFLQIKRHQRLVDEDVSVTAQPMTDV